ncbi:ABC transporter ATP-binding protein [Hirschia litorea]|uniref:ABC transporter ATP-binding protein n=1 Tax=Hirschia litorea TaxID=1199156 RepID=A0ABW2II02_9PROT
MNSPEILPDYAIQLKGLQKIYAAKGKMEEKHALKGVNLNIPRGSIFGLLGPNGAGKSTLINIVSGLVNKTAGEVNVWNYDLDKNPREVAAALGVVPQEINMDPFFTPRESMELTAGFFGVPKGERRSDEILEALGLGDKKDAYVRQLSGGMKRRLMVAKAMVHAPPILILDEPTAGVDVELRRQLWEYVKELHARGTTIVLTTHYLEEAQEMCDQIAIINHGEVIACEGTETLLSRMDRKKLIVQPEEAISNIPESIKGLNIERRIDGALVVTYRANETRVMDLLNQIRESGVRIKDLATEEADLEDVFVSMTTDA